MISKIANFISDLEGIGFFLTIILGVGLFGYVGVTWLMYLVNAGWYLVAAVTGGLLMVSVVAALLRVPAAQIVVLGSAVICGTAFLGGYSNLLLP